MFKKKEKKGMKRFLKVVDIFTIVCLLFIYLLMMVIFVFKFIEIFVSKSTNTSYLLTISIALVTVSLSLTAIVFTYQRAIGGKEEQRLKSIGENFILTSILFIVNFGVMGFLKIGFFDKIISKSPENIKIVFTVLLVVIILLSFFISFTLFMRQLWNLFSFVIDKKLARK